MLFCILLIFSYLLFFSIFHFSTYEHNFVYLFTNPLFIMTEEGSPEGFFESRPMEYSDSNKKTSQAKCCSPSLKARDIVFDHMHVSPSNKCRTTISWLFVLIVVYNSCYTSDLISFLHLWPERSLLVYLPSVISPNPWWGLTPKAPSLRLRGGLRSQVLLLVSSMAVLKWVSWGVSSCTEKWGPRFTH